MPRAKNNVARKRRVTKILKEAKGYYGKRKNLIRIAKQSVVRSGMFAFAHRRKKKSDFRKLWQVRINAALESFGISYSKFIHALKKADIVLNRKSLAYLAATDPGTFKSVVDQVSDTIKK
jgi:large subunit ribosomal protein L20